MKAATDIRTPLLILHSDNDLRCDVEQAGRLFTFLRLNERDVEMVLFPAEGHEMSRSGSPAHRVQRFEVLLDFFGRHLMSGDVSWILSEEPVRTESSLSEA